MLRIASTILFFSFFGQVALAQTDFFSGSVSELQSKALNENRSYILEFTTDWCQPCKKMDRDVFNDVEVGNYMTDSYLIVKVDAESEANLGLTMQKLVDAYPTFLVMNAKGEEQGRLVGYYSKYSFLKHLKEFKHKAPNTLYTEFR